MNMSGTEEEFTPYRRPYDPRTRQANPMQSSFTGESTNQRIEEIKKKYDTPSRRERVESMRKSREFELKGKDTRASVLCPPNNCLKDSFAVNRMEKSLMDTKGDYRQRREDQESIFSRMREMKESFIEKARPIRPIATAMQKEQIDPRIENIDKINFKIKHILSCLNENQRNSTKYSRPSTEQESITKYGRPSTEQQSITKYGRPSTEQESITKYGRPSIEPQNSSRESAFFGSRMEVEENQVCGLHVRDRSCDIGRVYNNEGGRGKGMQDKYGYRVSVEHKIIEDRFNSVENKTHIIENRPVVDVESRQTNQPIMESVDFWRNRSMLPTKKETMRASRSRSYIDSVKKSALISTNERQTNYLLSSGKKLNDQITKIQRKIEQFQEEKKKLNIQFTPFSTKNKSTTNLLQPITRKQVQDYSGSQQTTVIDRIRATSTPFNYNAQDAQSNTFHRSDNQESTPQADPIGNCRETIPKNECIGNYRDNPRPSSSFLPPKGRQRDTYNSRDIRKDPIETPTPYNRDPRKEPSESFYTRKDSAETAGAYNVRETRKSGVQNPPPQSKDQRKECEETASLCRRGDEGIEERRRRLQTVEQGARRETQRLVQALCEQAKIDEQLRNLKIWYDCCAEGGKATTLASLLPHLSPQQLAQELTVSEDEHNPFFTMHGFSSTLEHLAHVYRQANQYWEEHLRGQFSRQMLEEESFNEGRMDLERKGYIELEDLVRFLNIESGTFLRNRDVYLIYKRITKGRKLEFSGLLAALCK